MSAAFCILGRKLLNFSHIFIETLKASGNVLLSELAFQATKETFLLN